MNVMMGRVHVYIVVRSQIQSPPWQCTVQTRVFKGCREEILALTEVRGVKNNRVRTCAAIIKHVTSCARVSQQQLILWWNLYAAVISAH